MAKGEIIAGLDIGTNTMKALVVINKGRGWEVLCYRQMLSFGLRRGAIVNQEDTARNIQMLMSGVEKDCGRKIKSVFVNMGGSHLHVIPSDGLISVSRADHVISQEDVDRVLQATKAVDIPANEEILDIFPREYIINDRGGIKRAVGLTGVRLEAKVVLLCYFQSYYTNLLQTVFNAKLQIDDVVTSPIAAAKAVLTPQQKEIGVALIDIGAATTSLTVFEEGDLIHLAVFPLGSANITNDIAIGLKTEVSIAEEIKKQHGTCMLVKPEKSKEKSTTAKKIEVFDQNHELSFTKKTLVDIIEPRVSEILDLMQKELKSIGRQELLPGGIVITGGGAKLPKIKELVKEKLKLPCQIGVPSGIMGLEDDPSLATVVGLVLQGINPEVSHKEGSMGFMVDSLRGFMVKIKKMLRVFIP